MHWVYEVRVLGKTPAGDTLELYATVRLAARAYAKHRLAGQYVTLTYRRVAKG